MYDTSQIEILDHWHDLKANKAYDFEGERDGREEGNG